jgi:phosphatidylglycerophosphate synthase
VTMAGKLPPFMDVIKSRDVEDPIGLWLHRPLAYGLVAAVHRTPLTPNQVTLISMLIGVAAGVLWLIGTPPLMLLGGVLLWSSAFLDAVDGLLARTKNMHSELGRALDGSADMIVAIVTVFAAFYHIWVKHHVWWHLPLMVIALLTAVAQIYLYDFYKECYLQSLDPQWDGVNQALAQTTAKLQKARTEGASWLSRFAWGSYVGMLTGQDRLRHLTNPLGRRDDVRFTVNEETIRIYRGHNYWPMQLWTLVSLCPHTYVMSTCAMFDRLDLYLWFRIAVGNAIFVAAIVWQRIATGRTLRDLERAGAPPVPLEEPTAQDSST